MTSRVKEILDAFEAKDPATWTFADLESALIGLPRIRYYQDVKPIIKEADRLGCYPTVVKNFLQTNKKRLGMLHVSLSNWRINTAFNDDAQLYIVKGCCGEVLDCAVAWLDLAVGSVCDVWLLRCCNRCGGL